MKEIMGFWAGSIRAIILQSVSNSSESYTKRILDGCEVFSVSSNVFCFHFNGADRYAVAATWYLSKCIRNKDVALTTAITDTKIGQIFTGFEPVHESNRRSGAAQHLNSQSKFFGANKSGFHYILTSSGGSYGFSRSGAIP